MSWKFSRLTRPICASPTLTTGIFRSMGTRLRGVSQVCQESGALLLIAHHNEENARPTRLARRSWKTFRGRLPRVCPAMVACRPAGSRINRARVNIGYGCRRAVLPGTAAFGRLTLRRAPSDPWAADSGKLSVMPATEARADTQARQEQSKRQRAEERAAATLDSDRQELVKILRQAEGPGNQDGSAGPGCVWQGAVRAGFL